jgi:GIY-YIG catalytic domain.
MVKKKTIHKRKQEEEDTEQGGVYKVDCKECLKIYIGETKFNIEKRIKQHKMYNSTEPTMT